MCALRGLVKLKKKNPRKTRISQTSPTHPFIQFFIFSGNVLKHENNTKKHEKNTTFPKKIKIRVGALPSPPPPTHPLPSFILTCRNPLVRAALGPPSRRSQYLYNSLKKNSTVLHNRCKKHLNKNNSINNSVMPGNQETSTYRLSSVDTNW